ncbi:MAG: KEOPS complex subunit Pcc1 [Candidatus Hodarchaeales archaeon]|jgi:tRNA threonylcarbamoyladenosine modification (KEOPS) complex  Pcc1 subunit
MNKFDIQFSIHFDTEEESNIIFASLQPEIGKQRFDRSKVSLDLRSKKLIVNITAQDANAAKATVSSIIRWISASSEIITTIKTNF